MTTAADSAFGGPTLSSDEEQILDLLKNGSTNKEIARHFGIDVETAKARLTGVLQKLKVENRTQAVVWSLMRERSHAPASGGLSNGHIRATR